MTSVDVTCVKAEDAGPYQFHFDDPHVDENDFLTEVESPRFGKYWRYSPVVRFSHTDAKTGPGCLRGEHNESVLKELGYSDDSIKDLEDRGVTLHEEIHI